MAKKKTLKDLLGTSGERVKVDLDIAQDQYRGQISPSVGNIRLPDVRGQKPTNTENLIKALSGLNKNLSNVIPAAQTQATTQLTNLKSDLEGMSAEQKKEKLAEIQKEKSKKEQQINAFFRKDESLSGLNPFAVIGAKKLIGGSLSADYLKSLEGLPLEFQKDMVTTASDTAGTIPTQESIDNKIEEKLQTFYTENNITDPLIQQGLRKNSSTAIDRISSGLLEDLKLFHKDEILTKNFSKSLVTALSDNKYTSTNIAGAIESVTESFSDVDTLLPSEIEKAVISSVNLTLLEDAEIVLHNMELLGDITIGTTKFRDMESYSELISTLQAKEDKHEELVAEEKMDMVRGIISTEFHLLKGIDGGEAMPLDQVYQNLILGEVSNEGKFIGSNFNSLIELRSNIDTAVFNLLEKGKIDKNQYFLAMEDNESLFKSAESTIINGGVLMENQVGIEYDEDFVKNHLGNLVDELPDILRNSNLDMSNLSPTGQTLEGLIYDTKVGTNFKEVLNPAIASEVKELNISYENAYNSIFQQAYRISGDMDAKLNFTNTKLDELAKKYKEQVKGIVVREHFPNVDTVELGNIQDNPSYISAAINPNELAKEDNFIINTGINLKGNLSILNSNNVGNMYLNNESLLPISEGITEYFDFLSQQDRDVDFLNSSTHTQIMKKFGQENIAAKQLLAQAMQYSNNHDLSNEPKPTYYNRSEKVQNLLTLTGINFGDAARIAQNGSNNEYYLPTGEYLDERYINDIGNGDIPIFGMFNDDEINFYLDKDNVTYDDASDNIKMIMDMYNIPKEITDAFIKLQAQKVSQFNMMGINSGNSMFTELVGPVTKDRIEQAKADAINRDVGGDSIQFGGIGELGRVVANPFVKLFKGINEALTFEGAISLPTDFQYNTGENINE